MGVIENSLAFVFVLGVMVLIHELGHFLAARYFDVRVESFSIGFGPRLFGFKRGDTDYKICALPLGGYVKMAGEAFGEPTGDPDEFLSKPRWQRLIIVAMGPIFNGVLAVALLMGLYMFHYETVAFLEEPAVVAKVEESSPAQKAGVQPGDRILSIDSQATPDWKSVHLAVLTAANKTVPVVIDRDGQQQTLEVAVESNKNDVGEAGWIEASPIRLDPIKGTPAEKAGVEPGDIVVAIDGEKVRYDGDVLERIQKSAGAPLEFTLERGGRQVQVDVSAEQDTNPDGSPTWRIGAYIGPVRTVTSLSAGAALEQSLEDNKKYAMLIFRFLQGLFEQRMSPRSLEGPIGIARLSGEAARAGWERLIELMAGISLNLGIFNLLPIPILDGGGILLLLIESVMRRDISLAVKERIVQVGLVFLVLLFAFVMFNDIQKSLPN
ncbi:MAG: RIP metalloprotease RseP [Bryobacterales bacterium]|nr:RIP metalloprotease RseP [Acidobacteriota bacterium]MCB9386035.1 RIP metalloprotease RseP [Bryobacterales bacterium]